MGWKPSAARRSNTAGAKPQLGASVADMTARAVGVAHRSAAYTKYNETFILSGIAIYLLIWRHGLSSPHIESSNLTGSA